MQNKDNCELCYHPRPASGCGWVVVGIVGLFVSICVIAGVYHEVQFHGDPVPTLPARDSVQIDTSLQDHSKILNEFPGLDTIWIVPEGQENVLGSQYSDDSIAPPIQKVYDSLRHMIWPDSAQKDTERWFNGEFAPFSEGVHPENPDQEYGAGTLIGECKGFVSIINDHGGDTISVWYNDARIARGLVNGRILYKDSAAYDHAKEFVRKSAVKTWGDSL